MKRIAIVLALTVSSGSLLYAQAQPAPQDARQALIEMFFSKKPGSLEKHLPEATRAALHQADGPGLAMLQQFSVASSQMTAHGERLQTFDAGSTLASAEDPRTDSKFEVLVERDGLQGEEDEIELSFHSYKDGKQQNSYLMPHITFIMKQEAGIWRLNELELAMRVGLADPELLKALTESMKQRQVVTEAAAVGNLRTILTAEVTYSATYPNRGYTCTISDLGGSGQGKTDEHHAMLLSSGLTTGEWGGYRFALSGYSGTPASRFKATAVPADGGSGKRTFCGDETGVVRYSTDGNAATCLSVGKPLQ